MDRIYTCLFLQLERIENKLDLLTETQDEQGRMLDEQGKMLDGQGKMMDEQGRVMNEQGKSLDELRKTQNEHGNILNLLLEYSGHGGTNKINETADASKCSNDTSEAPSQGKWLKSPLHQNVITESTGKSNESTDDIQTKQELRSKISALLDDLTLQNLDDTAAQIRKLPINEPDHLDCLAYLIWNKAIVNPGVNEKYAKLSKILCTGSFFKINNNEVYNINQTDFRRVFLNKCQSLLNRELDNHKMAKESGLSRPEGEQVNRLNGSYQFLGELFKLDMIKTCIMNACIKVLLELTEDEPLESLCKLLMMIGKHYESRLENRNQSLDPIMDELAKRAQKNSRQQENAPQISTRTRFIIQDVLDLRANNWESKQDIRKKIGGRTNGSSVNEDNWRTPKEPFKTKVKRSMNEITSTSENGIEISESPSSTSEIVSTSDERMEPSSETQRLGLPRPNSCSSSTDTSEEIQPRQSRSESSPVDPLMCPKSTSRSVPMVQQPPPGDRQPVLDDECMKKLVKIIVEEYIVTKNLRKVEGQLRFSFVTPACLRKFVDYFMEHFLEMRRDQDVIAPMLAQILDSKRCNLTPQLLVESLHEFFSSVDDLMIDYPKIWDYVAMVMGHTLMSEHFNFNHVLQSCRPILRSNNSKKCLSGIFNVINSLKNPIWISCKWNESNVTLEDFLKDNDVDEFIKTNGLEYLINPSAPVLKSETPKLKFDDIKTKLLQILRDNSGNAFVPAQSWVIKNFRSGPYDHSLIRPLMTAICEASIIGPREENQLNQAALKENSKLIRHFVDFNPNLEAHCLYALSLLLEKLDHPQGLTLSFFQNLMGTLSPEGFERFRSGDVDPPENNEENRIRGIVTLKTRPFWMSIPLPTPK